MGSVAHAVLERLHYGLEHQPEGARIRELAHISGRRSGLTQEQCAELAQDLTRYVATISRAEQVLAREVPFMLNPAPRLFIRGQIDVLLKTVDTIVVRDYKYATKSDASRYQIQLECYVLAVAEHFPTSRIETQIVTLRDEASVITLPTPSASAIKAKIAELGDRLGQAARNSDYGMAPANAAVCKALRCGYRARCWNGG
jgi:ATP-dependent exoDNAse (exonuclease V) beta subunit